MPQRYEIFYTSTAEQNITERLMYIMQQYRDTALAERWYNRLRALIQENLTAFPAKYPLYDVEPWSSAEIRQYVTRNDVILYSVDENRSCVYIRSVCTRAVEIWIYTCRSRVRVWSKTKRAAIAALFFYHKPLISRLTSCDDLYCDQK